MPYGPRRNKMSAAAAGTPESDLAQAEDCSSLEIISDSDSDD